MRRVGDPIQRGGAGQERGHLLAGDIVGRAVIVEIRRVAARGDPEVIDRVDVGVVDTAGQVGEGVGRVDRERHRRNQQDGDRDREQAAPTSAGHAQPGALPGGAQGGQFRLLRVQSGENLTHLQIRHHFLRVLKTVSSPAASWPPASPGHRTSFRHGQWWRTVTHPHGSRQAGDSRSPGDQMPGLSRVALIGRRGRTTGRGCWRWRVACRARGRTTPRIGFDYLADYVEKRRHIRMARFSTSETPPSKNGARVGISVIRM
jgi:hypothetical protein